ncbi:MAG: porin family protein [Thermoanaerobaculia bacterium]
MKRLVAPLVLCLSVVAGALPASAQEGFWLGAKAGYGWSSPDVSTDLDILKGTDASGGLVAGLVAEGAWYRGLSVQGEVLYVRRAATNTYWGGTNDQGHYQGDVSADYTFETLEIPLLVKYTFTTGRLSPFVLAGVNTAISLSVDSKTRDPQASGSEKATDQFAKYWFSLEVGAGAQLEVGNGVFLTLDGRYVHGLGNAAAEGIDDWKWRDVRLLGGVKFRM